MRILDNNGLILCDLQSELFEKSLSLDCSSEIFIRRFMNSKIVKQFDSTQILDDTLTIPDIYEHLVNEYGESSYGSIKYSKNELYWIGHIYRYLSYTYEISSKQVYKIIKPKELRNLFLAYHTFDTKQAIERILEAKNIVLDKDYTEAGIQILRKIRKNVVIHHMKLWNDSFESIKKGIKTIEMRLNDEKRSKIKTGDIIEFTNTSTLEKLKVKVDRIYKYDNFEQLYQHHDKISIGYKTNEVADPNDMLMYYKKEEIEKYGVLGIKVIVIEIVDMN